MEDFTSNPQVHANTLRTVVIFLFVFVFQFSYAQKALSTSSNKAEKLYLKADKKYRERDFEAALELLEEAAKRDPDFFEAYVRMGSLYNALGELDSVYSKFKSYVETAPDPIASVLERTSNLAFDKGEYLNAEKYLNQFLDKVPEKRSDREIDLLLKSIAFAKAQIQNPASIEISELPPEINRYRLQYLPALTIDQSTLIYTKRDVFSDDEDIVVSYRKDGKWESSQSISPRINTSLNEGACTISADGRTMIFTSCDRRDALGSCDLYVTSKTGDFWSRPRNLGSPVNSRYWESQPSLSADGKTLYFASNRPGGQGGRDIWVAKNVDGRWMKPKNLGETINTFKDETTPYIHFNGESLFFSSNGHTGMGGFDLYSATLKDTLWTKPHNLGYPVNSHRDEVALLVAADGISGFYAKELLKNREILDSKIVSMKLPEHLRPKASSYVIGIVLDEKTKKPLKASVQVYDISSNRKLYDNTSDSITGQYYMVLPPGQKLAGYVKKKGYLFKDFSFNSGYQSSYTITLELSPVEAGKTLVLNNIYFETDSYDLDNSSQSEIQGVAELLVENPYLYIEIGGHTDNIGTSQYNQELSENRARAVFEALVKEGINPEQVTYTGYGDTRPLMLNNTEINRQSNRRIEFRVIRTK